MLGGNLGSLLYGDVSVMSTSLQGVQRRMVFSVCFFNYNFLLFIYICDLVHGVETIYGLC